MTETLYLYFYILVLFLVGLAFVLSATRKINNLLNVQIKVLVALIQKTGMVRTPEEVATDTADAYKEELEEELKEAAKDAEERTED